MNNRVWLAAFFIGATASIGACLIVSNGHIFKTMLLIGCAFTAGCLMREKL